MLGQPRTTQRRARKVAEGAIEVRDSRVDPAARRVRMSASRAGGLAQAGGADRRQGAKVRRSRIEVGCGSTCAGRLRPLYRGHVWSYTVASGRTTGVRSWVLASRSAWRSWWLASRSHDVLEVLPIGDTGLPSI